jgi:hypothetical protein
MEGGLGGARRQAHPGVYPSALADNASLAESLTGC